MVLFALCRIILAAHECNYLDCQKFQIDIPQEIGSGTIITSAIVGQHEIFTKYANNEQL